MPSVIQAVEAKFRKHDVVNVQSGDTVKVHQKIKEGNKERTQIFEGLVIRTDRKGSHTSCITVRRIASGIGVEKTYLLHSPLVIKVEVTKRSKVRRKYLTYMRARTGKSARLASVEFDKTSVNTVEEAPPTSSEENVSATDAADEPKSANNDAKSPETTENVDKKSTKADQKN